MFIDFNNPSHSHPVFRRNRIVSKEGQADVLLDLYLFFAKDIRDGIHRWLWKDGKNKGVEDNYYAICLLYIISYRYEVLGSRATQAQKYIQERYGHNSSTAYGYAHVKERWEQALKDDWFYVSTKQLSKINKYLKKAREYEALYQL